MLHGIITQGTTPDQNFELPFSTSLLSKVSVTYTQKGKVVLIKKLKDCKLKDNSITVTLTQQDTFLFDPNNIVIVQIKLMTTDNEVMLSDDYRLLVKEAYDKEVF